MVNMRKKPSIINHLLSSWNYIPFPPVYSHSPAIYNKQIKFLRTPDDFVVSCVTMEKYDGRASG